MKQYKVTPIKQQSSAMSFHMAKMDKQFDNLRVINGSEETIFSETYVTGLLTNNRVVKFKKDTLVFALTYEASM